MRREGLFLADLPSAEWVEYVRALEGVEEQLETAEANLRGCRKLLKQALDSERLLRSALELIRDTRSEDGSNLISGRDAEAIAWAALSNSNPATEPHEHVWKPTLDGNEYACVICGAFRSRGVSAPAKRPS